MELTPLDALEEALLVNIYSRPDPTRIDRLSEGTGVDYSTISTALLSLATRGLVCRNVLQDGVTWERTHQGMLRVEMDTALRSKAGLLPVPYEHKPTQIQATVYNRPEPSQPAMALLCVDEDELDGWWEDQDVEVKADAFARWALNRDRSFIYCEPSERRIPIAGATDDNAQHSRAAREGAVLQGDGDGRRAVQEC